MTTLFIRVIRPSSILLCAMMFSTLTQADNILQFTGCFFDPDENTMVDWVHPDPSNASIHETAQTLIDWDLTTPAPPVSRAEIDSLMDALVWGAQIFIRPPASGATPVVAMNASLGRRNQIARRLVSLPNITDATLQKVDLLAQRLFADFSQPQISEKAPSASAGSSTPAQTTGSVSDFLLIARFIDDAAHSIARGPLTTHALLTLKLQSGLWQQILAAVPPAKTSYFENGFVMGRRFIAEDVKWRSQPSVTAKDLQLFIAALVSAPGSLPAEALPGFIENSFGLYPDLTTALGVVQLLASYDLRKSNEAERAALQHSGLRLIQLLNANSFALSDGVAVQAFANAFPAISDHLSPAARRGAYDLIRAVRKHPATARLSNEAQSALQKLQVQIVRLIRN